MPNQEWFHLDRMDYWVRPQVISADDGTRVGSLNELQAAIGQWLLVEYNLGQPIPQPLIDLLRQLEQRELNLTQ
jgi:hypothetical protein